MLEQLTKEQLMEMETGDYMDNNEVDTACARRLYHLCRNYGKDGHTAQKLLESAFELIEVYV